MLEDPFVQRRAGHEPRATMILAAGEAANHRTEIWMGGAYTHFGEELHRESLGASWLIDCAGDIDRSYRESTARWLACVFADLDGPLSSSARVSDVVRESLDAIVLRNGEAPDRIYVMCQHGMNRSGLVSGLILRGLGLGPHETVDRIRLARPGALANDYFRHMLLRD